MDEAAVVTRRATPFGHRRLARARWLRVSPRSPRLSLR